MDKEDKGTLLLILIAILVAMMLVMLLLSYALAESTYMITEEPIEVIIPKLPTQIVTIVYEPTSLIFNEYMELKQTKPVIELEKEIYTVTAYCPCSKCCGKSDGITASGVLAIEGITVAADPKILPMGTHIYIEGYGERIVQDVGGAVKGNRLDLYFDKHSDALVFGRKKLEVTILD